jgi:GH25 family lysozyme M1 (1,4-beta-N-acetylmuramidase)
MIFPDVSHHHPVVDFKKTKKYKVLISKATEGTTYVDPSLEAFVEGCERNGIDY